MTAPDTDPTAPDPSVRFAEIRAQHPAYRTGDDVTFLLDYHDDELHRIRLEAGRAWSDGVAEGLRLAARPAGLLRARMAELPWWVTAGQVAAGVALVAGLWAVA